jgi:D-3-phosphoglycerate dehydrogenase
MEAASSLALIIRAGAGTNTIDVDCAGRMGVYVCNCPGTNTDAVAEIAMAHLIAADRRVVPAACDMRAGKWRKKEYGNSAGLKGRTLGVIGLGAIGKGVAHRAAAMDMEVIAWSRSLTPELAEELGIGYCASPSEVASRADAISLHLAANAETKHMINKEFLAGMKDGAVLINTARGEVVDTAALKEAIREKGLRVGLDVFENEPTGGEAEFADTELAELAACTPHIGASTDQAADAVGDSVVQIVAAYKDTGMPLNPVNLRAKSSAVATLVVQHLNKVGVLAGVLDALRGNGINVEEMQNTVFRGGESACCSLKLDEVPASDVLARIGGDENIIQLRLG